MTLLGKDLDTINQSFLKLQGPGNGGELQGKPKVLSNLIKAITATPAQIELSVSDDQFKARIADDQKLIETFFGKIKEAGNDKIDIDGILKGLNINAENHANLFEYLSGQDADSLSKLKDASDLTKNYAASQDELRIKTAGATAELVAMKLATAALNTIISFVLSSVINLLIKQINKSDDAIKKAHELTQVWENQRKTLSSNKNTIDNISSDYQRLSQGVDSLGRNISLTTEQYAQYNDIVNQIADMFPELVMGHTEEGNAILKTKGDIEELTKAYEKLREENRKAVLNNANEVLDGYQKEIGPTKVGDAKYATKLLQTNSLKEIIDLYNQKNYNALRLESWVNGKRHDESYQEYNERKIKYETLRKALEENVDGVNIETFHIFDQLDSQQIFEMFNKIQSAYNSLVKDLNTSTNQIKPILSALLEDEDYLGFDFQKLDQETQDGIKQIVSNFDYQFFSQFKTKEDMETWLRDNLITPLTDPNTSQQMKNALSSLLNFMNGDAWTNLSIPEYQNQLEALQKALPEDLWEKVKVYITPEFSLEDSKSQIEEKIEYALTEDEFNKLSISDIQIILNPDFVFDKNSGEKLQAQIDKFIEEQKKANAAKRAESLISDYQTKSTMASSVRDKIASGTLTADEAKKFMDENSTYDWSQVDFVTGKFEKLKKVLDEITESSYKDAIQGIDDAIAATQEDLAKKQADLALVYKNGGSDLYDDNYINSLKAETAEYENQINALNQKKQYLKAVHGESIISLASEEASKATKALDDLQSAYNVASQAIEEYNSTGSMSVDNYQSIISLAGTYLGYLMDENGELNLNQEALRKVAAARILESGAKSAELLLNTVTAYSDEGKSLDDLTGVFNENTSAIWSNVYAKLALIEADDKLTEDQKKKIRAEVEGLEKLTNDQVKQIESGNWGNFKSGSSSNSGDDWLDAYEKERAALDHLYKMELIDAQEYYNGIEKLRQKYFVGRKKYIDKDRGLQEELFDLDREIAKKRISDIEHEIYLLEQREEIEKSRIDSAEDAGKIDLTQYKNIENQKLQYYIKIREETNRQLRAAYAYGLDDHSDYVQELQKQWYEANQNMVQVYEDLLSTLESKRDNFQSQQSSMLDAYLNVLEKEKSALEDQKKEEEEYWKERIDNYKKEHDEQEKTNELEEKRLKLLNIKNQKNVLMYDKEKGWIRTYDHSAYDEAKKDYDKALADKEYNDELERLENERDAALDSIQNQIDSIEKLRDTYKDKFDEINDILSMTEDQLKSLDEFTKMSAEEREKYLESFVNNFKSKMEEMIAEINKVKDAVKFTQNGINDIFGYANSKPGVVSDDYRVYKDKTTGAGTMIKNSDITWRGKTPSQAQIDEWEKAGWRYAGDGGWWKEGKKYYAMGGVVEDTGIAKLHGDKVHSEVVFNAADAKKLYDYIHNTPSLILDLSKKLFANNSPNPKPTTALAANGGSGEQHFHIGQLSFPNVTDGQDVIDTIRELPNYFLQQKYKK